MVKQVGTYEDFIPYDQEEDLENIVDINNDELYVWYGSDSDREKSETLAVRAVSIEDPQPIVLHSGAAVSLLP